MKHLFASILVLTFSIFAHATDEACMNRIRELIKTDSEKYLFENRPEVLGVFNINCSSNEFGESIVNNGAVIFVHEAAHFEDLDLDLSGTSSKETNIYTVNNEHIGTVKNVTELPIVREIVTPYLQAKRPYLLSNEVFMHLHGIYLAADDSMAAEFITGIATELNAYTHGSVIQARMQALIPQKLIVRNGEHEYQLENPLKNKITQLDGILYFIYNMNLYLKVIKAERPEIWKEFDIDQNRVFLDKLLSSSLGVLKDLDHCSLSKSKENSNLEFYIEELKKEDLSVLKEILGDDKIADLVCSHKEDLSVLKDILGDNKTADLVCSH
ncbi:hypothetical protein [Peredibacter starrii]|uniref:Uncharacterized protein n=1 Tax=Peredibacter starrii TaxID=28202 RepID=A0AAX4HN36_9BACT|nr:hypothetical protein [Peredibacter starrii]WPU64671.1 hypothetical protein SOO65_18410 [Peredibacter starrii]